MNNNRADESLVEFERLRIDINNEVAQLSLTPPFRKIGLVRPAINFGELSFLKVVFWLYTHYWETGKLSLRFLERYLDSEGSNNLDILAHPRNIQQLRTQAVHNLSYDSESDLGTQRACRIWFSNTCENQRPSTEEEWFKCLDRISSDAKIYLGQILQVIERIRDLDNSAEIIGIWRHKLSHNLDPYVFEQIVEEVCVDLGRSALDPQKFCKANYSKWLKILQSIADEADIKGEARRIVEATLLEDLPILPIDGQDVMKHFQIPPGSGVGNYLIQARKLYERNPCDKKELLERLARNDTDN